MARLSIALGSIPLALAAVAAALVLSTAAGCDEKDTVSNGVAVVKMGGKTFHLEVAAIDEKRFKGLSGREHIEDDGGMIFVIPRSQVRVQGFVMRDCPIPIDIAYCDGAGRVLTTYTMEPEPPRTEDEKVLSPHKEMPTAPQWTWQNEQYENRLKRYSSRFPATFVIEVKGGTIKTLGVKEGDVVTFDAAGLKKIAE